jgi:predicted adenylyl cyclase CyaB
MARNVEIKANLREEARVRAFMQARGSRHETQHQRDVFFVTLQGRLKLRCFPDGTGVLVAYERPDQSGPKMSNYTLAPVAEAGKLESALTRTLGVRGIVEKKREIAIVGQTRIHLDEVRGLGTFLELEVVLREEQSEHEGQAIAAELMDELGITNDDLLDRAYIDMLEEIRR